jgi:hypothetical protein
MPSLAGSKLGIVVIGGLADAGRTEATSTTLTTRRRQPGAVRTLYLKDSQRRFVSPDGKTILFMKRGQPPTVVASPGSGIHGG